MARIRPALTWLERRAHSDDAQPPPHEAWPLGLSPLPQGSGTIKSSHCLTYNSVLPEEALSWLVSPPTRCHSPHPSSPLPADLCLTTRVPDRHRRNWAVHPAAAAAAGGGRVGRVDVVHPRRGTSPSLHFPTLQCTVRQDVDADVVVHPPVMLQPLTAVLKYVGVVHPPSPPLYRSSRGGAS